MLILETIDFMLIPLFVRFNIVMFCYKIANESQRHDYDLDEYYNDERTAIKLSEEYEWIQMIREWPKMILQPLKTALKGAEFCFAYTIRCFSLV